jgi:hypothetical protein
MSIDATVVRSMRTTAPWQSTNLVTGLSSVTERFFSRGDEQEASQYKDVVLDSLDKIPRRRRTVFAMAGLLSLLAIGAVTWRIERRRPSGRPSVSVIQRGPASIHSGMGAASIAADPRSVITPIVGEPKAPAPDRTSNTLARTIRPIALHGVVWSAAANQLVPVERAAVESEPSVAATPELKAPPEEDLGAGSTATSPAPFEPAGTPTETAPILM